MCQQDMAVQVQRPAFEYYIAKGLHITRQRGIFCNHKIRIQLRPAFHLLQIGGVLLLCNQGNYWLHSAVCHSFLINFR